MSCVPSKSDDSCSNIKKSFHGAELFRFHYILQKDVLLTTDCHYRISFFTFCFFTGRIVFWLNRPLFPLIFDKFRTFPPKFGILLLVSCHSSCSSITWVQICRNVMPISHWNQSEGFLHSVVNKWLPYALVLKPVQFSEAVHPDVGFSQIPVL